MKNNKRRTPLEEAKETAMGALIGACSGRFTHVVLKDKDLREIQTSAFFKEWGKLTKAASNFALPDDKVKLTQMEDEIFGDASEYITVGDEVLIKPDIYGTEGKEREKLKYNFLTEYLCGYLESEKDYVLAVSLDNIIKEISKSYDSTKFNDKEYILDLMVKENKSFPFLFAGEEVKDNPNMVLKACKKGWWFFDMASERLRNLSLSHDLKKILDNDILRYNLEEELSNNSSEKKKSMKI